MSSEQDSYPGSTVQSALHDAAARGDIEAITASVEAGLDINGRDDAGRTPLMVATYANQVDAFRTLLDRGADVDLQDDQLNNPFLYAGAEGLMEILAIAHQAGADPAITNRYGGVAIIPAAEKGHLDAVRYLLEHTSVDVNHVNNLGWTALLEAVILTDGGPVHQQIIRELLAHGADTSIADSDGLSPLDHARQRSFDKIVEILETHDQFSSST